MIDRRAQHNAAQALAAIPWLGPRLVVRAQRRFGLFSVQHWSEAIEVVTADEPDVVSLDVFDTVLTRRLAGDRAIEHAIADRGSPDADADLEWELCRPVPGSIEALERIRKEVPNVVYLSDTDRSSQLLIEILSSYGLFISGDRLLASCEHQATKSAGDLHRHPTYRNALADVARRNTGVTTDPQVIHVGNDQWADGTMALAAGHRVVLYRGAEANRYERCLLGDSGSTDEVAGYGPALASSARTARLDEQRSESEGRQGPGPVDRDRGEAMSDAERARIAFSIGADVAGPALVAFVLWVAERCRHHDIDHVVFLARDGELPLKLAQAIPGDHWEGRTLDYLHCSRLTWSLASACALGVDKWIRAGTADSDAFLHNRRHSLPFGSLLERVGLEVGDIEPGSGPISGHDDLASLDPDVALPESLGSAWEAMLVDPEVRAVILDRSQQRRDLILDHLRGEGFPQTGVALVDVGWRGRLAWQISAVLSDLVEGDPIHLHFGGDKVIAEVDAEISIERFAFDGYRPPRPVSGPVSCVETLTASGKPRVIDYRRKADGSVEQVFGLETSSMNDGRTALWAGALRMAATVPSRSELDSWGLRPDPLDDEVRTLLGTWWNTPDPVEAESLQSVVFERDEAGTRLRPLVSPYGPAELVRLTSPKPRQWRHGSVSVSKAPIRYLVRPLLMLDEALERGRSGNSR